MRSILILIGLVLTLRPTLAASEGQTVFEPPQFVTEGYKAGNEQAVVLGRRLFAFYERITRAGDRQMFLRRSTNGGRTWRPAVNLTAKIGVTSLHYQVAGSAPGTLHIIWGLSRQRLYSRSDDSGATWTEPRLMGADARTMVVEGDRVHVFGNGPFAGVDQTIHYFGSTDGGRTWSAPKIITDLGFESDPKATAVGDTLYVTWSREGRRQDFSPGPGVYVAASYDGGLEWADPIRIMEITPSQQGPTPWPVASGDAAVVFFIQYPGCGGSRLELLSIRSEDRGLTWSQPKCLSDNREESITSWDVAMDPTGRIHLLFRVLRRGVVYRSSTDLARSWEPAVNLGLESDSKASDQAVPMASASSSEKRLAVSAKRVLALAVASTFTEDWCLRIVANVRKLKKRARGERDI